MLQTPFQEKTLLDRVLVHFELNVYLKPFPQANNHNKNLFQEDLIYQERCADREGLKKREIFSKKREIFKRKLIFSRCSLMGSRYPSFRLEKSTEPNLVVI